VRAQGHVPFLSYPVENILNLAERPHQLYTPSKYLGLHLHKHSLLLVRILSFRSFLLFVLDGRPDSSSYHHALTNIVNNLSPSIHLIKVAETSDALSTLPEQPPQHLQPRPDHEHDPHSYGEGEPSVPWQHPPTSMLGSLLSLVDALKSSKTSRSAPHLLSRSQANDTS